MVRRDDISTDFPGIGLDPDFPQLLVDSIAGQSWLPIFGANRVENDCWLSDD